MPDTETEVAAHYTTGGLTARVRSALEVAGVDPNAATSADLKPVDEFHTGGVEATDHLLAQLAMDSSTRVLDIGSGVGGAARLIADRFGAAVTGVDLTPEFVATAGDLSNMVGLGGLTTFKVGSGTALPVADDSADLALLLHVGMNIADKTALFAEAARALRPGGTFAVFDVMRAPDCDEPLVFPLPWSTLPDTSFVATPAEYEAAARAAGFNSSGAADRSDFTRAFFKRAFAAAASSGPPPLGIHLMMGDTFKQKMSNYVENLNAGRIAPTEMIFHLPA